MIVIKLGEEQMPLCREHSLSCNENRLGNDRDTLKQLRVLLVTLKHTDKRFSSGLCVLT